MTRLWNPRSLVRRWDQFWFAEVPSEAMALVRIAVGLAGLVNLIGFTPVEPFWMLDGLAPLPGGGLGFRSYLIESGLGTAAGWTFFVALSTAFVCMVLGFFANAFILVCFLGSLLQVRWNPLPLTAGHGVLLAILFCLIWADCGARLSIGERSRRRSPGDLVGEQGTRPWRVNDRSRQPYWPLRLIQVQVALIYLTSGLFKLFGTAWRDGSAVYYATGQNIFGRIFHFYPFPASLGWMLTALTYATVLWELSFPLLILNRVTRRVALVTGIAMHLGIWATMEVGPFTWMMLAAYVAFLDPHTTQRVVKRFWHPEIDPFVRIHHSSTKGNTESEHEQG